MVLMDLSTDQVMHNVPAHVVSEVVKGLDLRYVRDAELAAAVSPWQAASIIQLIANAPESASWTEVGAGRWMAAAQHVFGGPAPDAMLSHLASLFVGERDCREASPRFTSLPARRRLVAGAAWPAS